MDHEVDRARIERALARPIRSPRTRLRLLAQLAASYERAGTTADFGRAVELFEEGLALTAADSRERLAFAFSLAQALVRNPSRSPDDIQRAAGLLDSCERGGHLLEPAARAFVGELQGAVLLELPGDRAINVEVAIDRLQAADTALRDLDAVRPHDRAIVLERLGDAFAERLEGNAQRNVDIALNAYLQAAALHGADLDGRHSVYRRIATLAARAADSDTLARAGALLDQVLEHDVQQGEALDQARDLAGRAGLLLRAAELGDSGARRRAFDALMAALELPAVAASGTERAALLVNAGAVLVDLSDPPDNALQLLEAAVGHADQQHSYPLRARARYHLGCWHAARDDHNAAARLFDASTAILEAQTRPDYSEAALDRLGRVAASLYEAAIDVQLDLAERRFATDAAPTGPAGGDPDPRLCRALDLLERNKSRALGSELAASVRERPTDVAPELWSELTQLRVRRRFLATRHRANRARRAPGWQHLADTHAAGAAADQVIDLAELETPQLLQDLDATAVRERALLDQIAQAAPHVVPAWPRDVLARAAPLLDASRAILMFVTTARATSVLVLTGTGDAPRLSVQRLPNLNHAALADLLQMHWLQPYRRYRAAALDAQADTGAARRAWSDAVAAIGVRLREALPLHSITNELAAAGVTELVLVPYRSLHRLPLHLGLDAGGRPLCDRFRVSYAPSLTILAACAQASFRTPHDGLFVEDPDRSLVFARLEVQLAQRRFGTAVHMAGPDCRAAAVLEAMSGRGLLHYTGHASFAERASALHLADRPLTMDEITAVADLSHCGLAVLSGCETAQVRLAPDADEYAGLPSAFLRAGVPTVVGTQWVVEDAAGPLFMHVFYEQLMRARKSPGEAFAAALADLRTISASALRERYANDPAAADPAMLRLLFAARYRQNPDEPLFDDPRYWGAFCLIGHP